ncbi:30S ribosomal protein S4 [Candidatus Falkowbacteria bacterium]|nr:30S ribosomal protein S4 [Candidatus Falkowbacteria bacterium]
MARNINAKCKQCRREGTKLFLKGERCMSPKCAMVKRNFPPGVHGGKGYPRSTSYGLQLREKQKTKKIYRLLEAQFYNYFVKASKSRANTEEVLFQLLEMRFDNIIYRAGFAKSRDLARQLIGHKHFLVNNKRVNIPSYRIKVGDTISVKEKSLMLKAFSNIKEQVKKVEGLSWLSITPDKLEIKVVDKPKLADLKEFNPKLIVEFYSK